VLRHVAIADGFVEVRFKPIAGREDQAGGVVWRWKDGDNYYVARANALENNVSLYYTERGSRKTIKYVDAPVAGGAWHCAARGVLGPAHPRGPRWRGAHRGGRRAHRGRRRRRRLDQGRQRHRVRRLRLRLVAVSAVVRRVLVAKGLRAFGDGYVSLLLPAYLLELGRSPFEVGVLATVTLVGSGVMTLGVGLHAYRFHYRAVLLAATALMAATGLGFAFITDFWPLLAIALVGTLNPSSGDVSVFLPLEHAVLSRVVADRDRTGVFARYSLVGSLVAAFGALAAGLPAWASHTWESGASRRCRVCSCSTRCSRASRRWSTADCPGRWSRT
jgi:hypothetical protein